MTTTTLELPAIRPLLNVRANPDAVTHPELKELTAKVHAARVAFKDALTEHDRLQSPALLEQARHADIIALNGATTGGTYTDPGTPNTDQLHADRAAAHRRAYALRTAAATAIDEWLDYLREHYDEITAYVRKPRTDAVKKITAAVTKALPDIGTVQAIDAEVAWLDRAAHEDSALNRIGPHGQYFVPPSPHPTSATIHAQVEALLDALNETTSTDTATEAAT